VTSSSPGAAPPPSLVAGESESFDVHFSSAVTELPAVAKSVSRTEEDSRGGSRQNLSRRNLLALLLLSVSVVTTTANGARFMQNSLDGAPPVVRDSDLWPWPWVFAHPEHFASGFGFSAALLTILLVHEFGHYFACRWHGIRSSLPWVLPAPTSTLRRIRF
jgi:hypothetical protein